MIFLEMQYFFFPSIQMDQEKPKKRKTLFNVRESAVLTLRP
jgi:hypothetical protein